MCRLESEVWSGEKERKEERTFGGPVYILVRKIELRMISYSTMAGLYIPSSGLRQSIRMIVIRSSGSVMRMR